MRADGGMRGGEKDDEGGERDNEGDEGKGAGMRRSWNEG
jgi:hypothetical protein